MPLFCRFFLFLQMGPRPWPTHTMVSPPRFFILPPMLLHGHCIVQIHSLVLVTNQLSPPIGEDSMNHSQTLFAWSTVFCVLHFECSIVQITE